MKKAFNLLITALILFGAAYIFLISNTETTIYPLPYEKKVKRLISDPLKKNVETSRVLFLGGALASEVSRQKEIISNELEGLSEEDIKLSFITGENDGLHRSILKLNEVEKLPPVVVFMGATNEFDELRFLLSEFNSLDANIKTYKDEDKFSSILLFPFLSKIFYKNIKKLQIENTPNIFTWSIKQKYHQQLLLMIYALFEMEVDFLFKRVQDEDRHMMVVIPPVNLAIRPNEVCHNANAPTIEYILGKVDEMINKNRLKDAQIELDAIEPSVKGHALFSYYQGQVALKTGQNLKAKAYLEQAHAFDCAPTRSGPVLNAILKKKAKEYQFDIFDLNQKLNTELGQNTLFLDDSNMHSLYFDRYIKDLAKVLTTYFRL